MKLSDDMQSMVGGLNKKIKMLETKVEKSERRIVDIITDKVTQIVDKRVNSEAAKIRKEMDNKMHDLRTDFSTEITELKNQLLEGVTGTGANDTDISLNVVITNLAYTVNENLTKSH
jgi:DUF2075 family protein